MIYCREAISPSDQRMIIHQAEKIMAENPKEALRLLSTVEDSTCEKEKSRSLLRLYLDQREYQKADSLLAAGVPASRDTIFFIKLKIGQQPISYCPNLEAKAIQYTIGGNWQKALRMFSIIDTTDPLIRFYYLKALIGAKDSTKALDIARSIDSLPDYLISDYYQMMIELYLWANPEKALTWVDLLKDQALKSYYKYQITNEEKYLWQIIKRYPRGWAAGYAIKIVKPKTKKQYLMFGKALFKRRRYRKAIGYLRKVASPQAFYLIGMSQLRLGNQTEAFGYLKESGLPEAYYEIARTLPDSEAIRYYKIVTLKRPRRSLKRKSMISQALALERMAKLNDAVAVELDFIDEFPGTETARRFLLRSAMNLITIGNLEKADSLLSLDSLSPFIYWRGRIRMIMHERPDSFFDRLKSDHPFSYYSICRLKTLPRLDTTPLIAWVSSLARSNDPDTSILKKIKRLYNLGLLQLADQAIYNFSTKDPTLLYRLAISARKLGLDWHSIRLARSLIRMGIRAGRRSFPLGLIQLAYPVRFLPSIISNADNIPLIAALIWQESNFNPNAVSPAGAIGLLQIMPRTGQLIADDLNEPFATDSLFNPMVSVRYGSYYLRGLKDELNSWTYVLIGYNAGPHRIRKWIKTYPTTNEEVFIELIPFVETRNYVKKILMLNEIYRWLLNLGNLS